MKTMLSAGRFVLAAAIAVALAGCESADPLGTSEPAAGRDFGAFEAQVLGQAEASGIDPTAFAEDGPALAPGERGRDWVFVQGSIGDEAVEAVIGMQGGVLNLGPHWLLVPRNAVREDVLFRLTPINDGTYHVELTATTIGSAVENDIGERGLYRPVLLGIQYDETLWDPASLAIAWLSDAGLVLQPTYTFQDRNGDEWAVGILQHFSGYILVAN